MNEQVLVLCEHRPEAGDGWELAARFLHASPRMLREQLAQAGLDDRSHPDDMSVPTRSELLFQDEEALGRTTLTVADLHTLQAHAAPEDWGNLHAWAAFMYALDPSGADVRLIVWFTVD